MKTKLILASTLCIATALGLVTLTVEHHTLKLAAQERERVQAMYTTSKENELKHYVNMAKTAIQKIAKSDQDEAKMQRQALGVLSQMHFGNDGYFFIYDRLGNLLLDPSQMGLQGVDFCEPSQPAGENQTKLLLQTASQGGGIVRYLWQKPSSQVMAPKMSYVIPVGQWGWILGAGMYLDDVEATLRQIDQDAQQNIEDTQQSIFWIAALSIVLMGLAGLAMNLSNHRVASEKLQRLARRLVRSQEDERVRVARELHDGVVQVMVSSKFLLEAAQVQLQQAQQAPTPPTQPTGRSPHRLLEQGVNRLNDALHEIHRVSHGLRPALLDDLGLTAALELLVTQSREQFPFALQWSRQGQPVELPTAHGPPCSVWCRKP
ncbi:MAG: Methyl-accepting chemotaxis protein 4 [Paracidovorax wautersii]|uniref:Methyl-accepting chemotaxis protein 4 n=1 Tax=Paracidovorax wautersii TaxID=1177982 RepID=A0A7V8FPI6_9BURK|nr:MAG: Methyl-accepting chemotaxis protein 4 [Paracidovorax wautersii]